MVFARISDGGPAFVSAASHSAINAAPMRDANLEKARAGNIALAASVVVTPRRRNVPSISHRTMNHGGPSYVSPDSNSKLSQHSVTHDDEHDKWSDGEGSSQDEGNRSQNGTSKRKRPLSVSCETCKQRKVKCDRGHPACGWCLKNHSQCTYLPRKKPGLRAGYGRELEARLGE